MFIYIEIVFLQTAYYESWYVPVAHLATAISPSVHPAEPCRVKPGGKMLYSSFKTPGQELVMSENGLY